MQTTSDAPPPGRGSAKGKSDPARPVVTVKKSRARKTSPAEPAAAPTVETGTAEGHAEDVSRMIATAAYFIAQERGFAPGHELDDWLEAERRITVIRFG